MITVADIHVLLPILCAPHALHRVAWHWWEQQADASVGLCVLTRLGTLRMLTNARVMDGQPVTAAQALVVWDTLAADPRCLWLDPDAGHEACFRQFIANRSVSPNLWIDTWLAALAAANGFRLTSFDADFRTVALPDFEHLRP